MVGGRARGAQRPRAPSLTERPGGERRAFGVAGVAGGSGSEGEGMNGGVRGRRGRGEGDMVD